MALLTEESLLQFLPKLSDSNDSHFWVAFSGGLDSLVMLDLLRKVLPAKQIRALHINHGLQPNADEWQQHCKKYCDSVGVEFLAKKVLVDTKSASLELQARTARYKFFSDLLQADDCLFMAHHQDDQIETVLYRLFRGSGPKGLAGIPKYRKLGRGRLYRPLLAFDKSELLEYAKNNKLAWIEDDSNQNLSFMRNFLRHQIIPEIKTRWPSLGSSIQKSAELSLEADHLLSSLAEIDARDALGEDQCVLELSSLKSLDPIRQRNVLRYWFHALSKVYSIPAPGFDELKAIAEELIPASSDAMPIVRWVHEEEEIQLRRFQNKLYVLRNFEQQISCPIQSIKPGQELELGRNVGKVSLIEVEEGGVVLEEGDELEIRLSCEVKGAKPEGRRTRSFKKLYQDYQVPPWLRDRVPMLFVNGELAAVADLFVCSSEVEKNRKKMVKITWQRPGIDCGS